jgi:hypothetical protein
MALLVKKDKSKKVGLTAEKLTQLQNFIDGVKSGEIVPFQEKVQQAKQNIRKAKLVK